MTAVSMRVLSLEINYFISTNVSIFHPSHIAAQRFYEVKSKKLKFCLIFALDPTQSGYFYGKIHKPKLVRRS